jgi:hypothetical protein
MAKKNDGKNKGILGRFRTQAKTVEQLTSHGFTDAVIRKIGAKNSVIGWSGTLRLLINLEDMNEPGGEIAIVRRGGRHVEDLGGVEFDHIVGTIKIDSPSAISTALSNYSDTQLKLSVIRLIRKSLNAEVPVFMPKSGEAGVYTQIFTKWSATRSGILVQKQVKNIISDMIKQTVSQDVKVNIGSLNTLDSANKTPKIVKVLINVATHRCILSCLLYYNINQKYDKRDQHTATVARATEFLEEFRDISSYLLLQKREGESTSEFDGLKLSQKDWNIIYSPSTAKGVSDKEKYDTMHAYSGFVERVYYKKDGEKENVDDSTPVKSLTNLKTSISEAIEAYKRQKAIAGLPHFVTAREQSGSRTNLVDTFDEMLGRLNIFEAFMKQQEGLKDEDKLYDENFELLDKTRLRNYKYSCTMNAVTGVTSKQFIPNVSEPDGSVPNTMIIRAHQDQTGDLPAEDFTGEDEDIPLSQTFSMTEATGFPALKGQQPRDQALN